MRFVSGTHGLVDAKVLENLISTQGEATQHVRVPTPSR